jgi:cullin 3
MIAKLKTECGYQWTNKLEGMFKDVQLSKDLCSKFKGVFDSEKNLDIVLDVNVCTTGYWPTSKMIPSNMPNALEEACAKFKRFYLHEHSGHKLEWRMDQGQAECLIVFSPKVRRTLIVTTYQMMVLVCFNVGQTLSYKQIQDVTGIPKNELANHILSLAHPSVKVLEKKPNKKELADDDKFRLNPQYTSKLMKVAIPLLKTVGNDDVDDPNDMVIELQRRHQIDAATVRIMKARKTMRHNLLVAEVIQQLSARFKPTPNMIKKRIEALIEQDYLARDVKDRSLYNYLA